jgi:hypothetical protein
VTGDDQQHIHTIEYSRAVVMTEIGRRSITEIDLSYLKGATQIESGLTIEPKAHSVRDAFLPI